MSSAGLPQIEDVLPNEAWGILEQDTSAVLIDVRTSAEWSFVGIPVLQPLPNRLLLVEWARMPDMSVNPGFVAEVMEQLGGDVPEKLLFLCRSGVRSKYAAEAVRAHLPDGGRGKRFVNVATGFEGDLDAERHRGTSNGWKVAGLPWRQG